MPRVPLFGALFGMLVAAALASAWSADTRPEGDRMGLEGPHMPLRVAHRAARVAGRGTALGPEEAIADLESPIPPELTDEDPQVRAEAAATLADTATASDVDALLLAWETMDTRTRVLSLYVMGRTVERFEHAGRDALLASEGLDLLAAAARSDASYASSAVLALGTLGTAPSTGVLVSLSHDVSDPHGADALLAMARFPSQENLAALESLARSSDDEVLRLKAVQAVQAAHWMHEGTVGAEFLATDGTAIALAIEEQSEIASVRFEARRLLRTLESL